MKLAFKKILQSSFITIILLIFIAFFSYSLYKNIKIRNELLLNLKKIREDIIELDKKNKKIEEYLKLSETPEFQEKKIKEDYNYKKIGENVYSIIKSGIEKELTLEKNSSKINSFSKSNPQKWFEYFFKK